MKKVFVFCGLVLSACFLTGCAETTLLAHVTKQFTGSVGHAQGHYKVGKPYKIKGVWYYPKEDFHYSETGIASWYGPGFHGKKTANGEIYDQYELTAAHKTLQLPSLVRVTNLENGRSLVVRVNDRGPYAHGRIIDMSKRGAELLRFRNQGTARVRVEVLTKESQAIAAKAKAGQDTTRYALDQKARPSKTRVETRPTGEAFAKTERQKPAVLLNDARMVPTEPVPLPEENISIAEKYAKMPIETETAYMESHNVKPSFKGHVAGDGRYMPDPVVEMLPVKQTQLYVQAGSFSIERNALVLSQKLSRISHVQVQPVIVDGKTFYRVRLGPLATTDHADRVLASVIQEGQTGARVIID